MLPIERKLVSAEHVRERSVGQRVVMCHGVFDILHAGHLAHLEGARAFGDMLVVGVTADEFARKTKPLLHNPTLERARHLAALEMVDFVIVSEAETPVELLHKLKPDVYVKGPDYAEGEGYQKVMSIEGPVLEKLGTELRFTSSEVRDSSTEILRNNMLQGLDVGPYHKDPEAYRALVERVYGETPDIVMPREFGRSFMDDLLMLTIRLARYKFAAKMLRKSDHVLEVGCGYGLGATFLGQACAHLTGIDVQQGCIDEAKRFCPLKNADFLRDDFLHTGLVTPYDVVVAMDVIEHLNVLAGRAFVEKLRQFVQPQGLVILGTPSVYSEPYQSQFSKLSHVHCYDAEELQRLLETRFERVQRFSMNDEVVHTGHPKMAWYYFYLCFYPRRS